MKSQSNRFKPFLLLVCLLSALPALAKPKLELAMTATKQVSELVAGKKVSKEVEAKSIAPGELITYTLSYVNKGDEAATDAVVDDPIPPGTAYVENSASGEGAYITFSNDGGKTYAKPVKLTYEMKLPSGKVEKRIATPSQYTHIRWTLKRVPPGTSGKLAFQAKVK
jgi:uncharacterized repeat protein (TIGR01451 family)